MRKVRVRGYVPKIVDVVHVDEKAYAQGCFGAYAQRFSTKQSAQSFCTSQSPCARMAAQPSRLCGTDSLLQILTSCFLNATAVPIPALKQLSENEWSRLIGSKTDNSHQHDQRTRIDTHHFHMQVLKKTGDKCLASHLSSDKYQVIIATTSFPRQH